MGIADTLTKSYLTTKPKTVTFPDHQRFPRRPCASKNFCPHSCACLLNALLDDSIGTGSRCPWLGTRLQTLWFLSRRRHRLRQHVESEPRHSHPAHFVPAARRKTQRWFRSSFQ